MRLITRAENARKATASWYSTYFQGGQWRYGEDKQEKYRSLLELGENPDADDVDRVIGNDSWTACRCDECGTLREVVLQIGEDPGYESATANICKPCLRKAAVYADF